MTLGASLRDSSRETRREKDRLSAWIENGGTKEYINDKRVHESLANVLISGERKGAGRKRFLFNGRPRRRRIKRRPARICVPRVSNFSYCFCPSSLYIRNIQLLKGIVCLLKFFLRIYIRVHLVRFNV